MRVAVADLVDVHLAVGRIGTDEQPGRVGLPSDADRDRAPSASLPTAIVAAVGFPGAADRVTVHCFAAPAYRSRRAGWSRPASAAGYTPYSDSRPMRPKCARQTIGAC